ncbi:MAG: ATP-dependent DNA helicase DinG [Gammaproteobacteria bacterium]|nr:ATP-dependent DNA helicase DinG [Gammaproteobacteria bacterium]
MKDDYKALIQGAYSSWLEGRGFRPRKGQREMIAYVTRALGGEQPRLCVIEAGTGTGKTAAYCLAVIPLAQALGLRVLISTATVALQEQVVFGDLPDLQAHTDLDFDFALAKGRRRYVCLKRLDERRYGDGAQESLLEVPEPQDVPTYQRMYSAFEQGDWNGELDTWDEGVRTQAWSAVTTDHRGCTHSRCGFFGVCPFYQARREAEEARVVVANHDLVLADLSLGGGVILPPPEETILVVDEAHHIADKAREHLTARARLRGTREWLEQVETTVGTCAQHFSRPRELVGLASSLADDAAVATGLIRDLESLAGQLDFDRAWEERANCRFALGRVPGQIADVCDPLSGSLGTLTERLATFQGYLEEVSKGERNWPNGYLAEDWLGPAGQMVGRGEEATLLFRDYASGTDGGVEGQLMARWVTRLRFEKDADLEFVSAPLQPGETLREKLWERCYGALCTSGTIRALGSFDRFLEKAGLPEASSQHFIPSPFDYPRLASFNVPAMRSDPRNAQAHTEEISELIPELLELEPSALALFSSRRQFREVVAALPVQIRDRCRLQDEGSKQALLKMHRSEVDAGEPSYILGLASFAEGVDLPHEYCRHVIIAKLPFAAPDNPVEQAFAEWLESQGRAPFFEVALPEAALRLVQACGRLIRHEEDYGRITLLDRRIVTFRYGRSILESLPPYRLEIGFRAE